MTRTQWFSCKEKPKRIGWYEIKWEDGCQGMRYWNGKHWLHGVTSFGYNSDQWRGLTKKVGIAKTARNFKQGK